MHDYRTNKIFEVQETECDELPAGGRHVSLGAGPLRRVLRVGTRQIIPHSAHDGASGRQRRLRIYARSVRFRTGGDQEKTL